MSNMPLIEKIANLSKFGNVVPEGYNYFQKLIEPAEDLHLPTAYLKWYNIYPADTEITPEQVAECRDFLSAEIEQLNLQAELGFVILHRAGSVLLLLLTTWRNVNEMWEAVYVYDLTPHGEYKAISYDTRHKATYCVWELGAVWHERNAWVRFLSSKRDDEAKLAYINDRFTAWV